MVRWCGGHLCRRAATLEDVEAAGALRGGDARVDVADGVVPDREATRIGWRRVCVWEGWMGRGGERSLEGGGGGRAPLAGDGGMGEVEVHLEAEPRPAVDQLLLRVVPATRRESALRGKELHLGGLEGVLGFGKEVLGFGGTAADRQTVRPPPMAREARQSETRT